MTRQSTNHKVTGHGTDDKVTGHGTDDEVEPDLAEYVRLDLLKTKRFAKQHMEKKPQEFLPKFAHEVIKVRIPENVKDVGHWGQAIIQEGKHKGRFSEGDSGHMLFRV